MDILTLALTVAIAVAVGICATRTPPPSAGAVAQGIRRGGIDASHNGTFPQRGKQDAAVTREAARQEHTNFLRYDGSPQPPIDPYQTAHHAAR